MHQLLLQIGLGCVLIAIATALQAIGIGLAMMWRPVLARWVARARLMHMSMVISAAGLWFLSGQMIGVWIWSAALLWLGAFATFEPALYYALAAYTTLGFGDVLPPPEWRILGAVIGANGMLGFGLGTAALVEFVRGVRR